MVRGDGLVTVLYNYCRMALGGEERVAAGFGDEELYRGEERKG